MKKLTVSTTGCSLADYLYMNLDFTGPFFMKYSSKKDGDGGLTPGRLVFAEDLERFAGRPYLEIRREICGGRTPDAFNLGGPAIVGCINAAQMLEGADVKLNFFGAMGNDETAAEIKKILAATPVNTENYIQIKGSTPCTDVLSDPKAHDGKGERTFINTIGACNSFTPEMLGDKFFAGDILWFGATALVPPIHDNLTALLKRGRDAGKINIVSTVFDFRSEKKAPSKPWPMGDSYDSYSLIDLLIVDWEEAMRLSGGKTIEEATSFFMKKGVSSFVITHGAKNFYAWSDGRLFAPFALKAMPISALVDHELTAHPEKRGDTTGCGDNFAGGIVGSLVKQIAGGVLRGKADMTDACAWAAASGGFACFCIGGTYVEKTPGEKASLLKRYRDAYLTQPGVKS